jgi:hypothetical protein
MLDDVAENCFLQLTFRVYQKGTQSQETFRVFAVCAIGPEHKFAME